MESNSSAIKYKNEIVKIIEKHCPACKIYLFGSQAKGKFKQTSDIDIALEDKNKIEKITISKIKDDLDESNIPFLIDLIDLNEISNEFKNNIKGDLVLWKL
ncbi:TPA: nucleotidyltransferase domain-containing protein [Candidatus Dependentiae bacterium]|nr:MAG: Toxin-antitoxin system, toxin component family protein [candidate division TM6 bacterium GW2011_GWE2_31_21]KKP53013.1 MAG: Toxin-antitoxin system, toxin component family protein [candidate division TM6 bacterium GW2011_GWF2_33_332]HBS47750.1 nucleotidyltransferase domain-containing protein [Candidatus Dependentiae bacterium]HBZ73274.1 nucleotidyltransferase domain-containing protein [Candidatus Dependentiae bacterium]